MYLKKVTTNRHALYAILFNIVFGNHTLRTQPLDQLFTLQVALISKINRRLSANKETDCEYKIILQRQRFSQKFFSMQEVICPHNVLHKMSPDLYTKSDLLMHHVAMICRLVCPNSSIQFTLFVFRCPFFFLYLLVLICRILFFYRIIFLMS